MRSGAEEPGAISSETRVVYEIQVDGELDPSWEQWLDGLTIKAVPAARPPLDTARPGRTTLTGVVADQAALRGLMCRLWDLNLTIVAVQRIERGEQSG